MLVAVMTMVQVEVKVEVDIIEVMEDKHVHKVGEEVQAKYGGV